MKKVLFLSENKDRNGCKRDGDRDIIRERESKCGRMGGERERERDKIFKSVKHQFGILPGVESANNYNGTNNNRTVIA